MYGLVRSCFITVPVHRFTVSFQGEMTIVKHGLLSTLSIIYTIPIRMPSVILSLTKFLKITSAIVIVSFLYVQYDSCMPACMWCMCSYVVCGICMGGVAHYPDRCYAMCSLHRLLNNPHLLFLDKWYNTMAWNTWFPQEGLPLRQSKSRTGQCPSGPQHQQMRQRKRSPSWEGWGRL